ncbi:hypothetical protein NDU88_006746 [Pleurodeles waltl]|uniref:Uncharacterized protein n=1 Tax=Pleurodeles waltl TaxID=8319 RepID=A0AAV7RMG4_PLEWA|nr:hypothetical protein NDU88_006746 [Pleurodeles waltl]
MQPVPTFEGEGRCGEGSLRRTTGSVVHWGRPSRFPRIVTLAGVEARPVPGARPWPQGGHWPGTSQAEKRRPHLPEQWEGLAGCPP